jgi:hypothetical protein
MARTDQDFKDGLALDLFSPKNRTLVVKQNTSPLPAGFITGTTGEPFIALSSYSYIIQMNETANDLIAKIEVPYDPEQLKKVGVQEANTYVATLAADKMSWVIDDSTRNVHRSENNTRIIKMTSMDGEYLLVGRQTVDTSNIFVQYGQGATRTVNMTGGSGKYASLPFFSAKCSTIVRRRQHPRWKVCTSYHTKLIPYPLGNRQNSLTACASQCKPTGQ